MESSRQEEKRIPKNTWRRTMLEEAKEINKTWAEIKAEAKNSEIEDSSGSPMFHCGMMGCYIYI
jgi:hypothetical protein